MSDISKCEGVNCRIKKSCFRFTAPINELYQSWSNFEYNQQTRMCDFYWEVQNPVGDALKKSAKTVMDIYAARAERNKQLKNKTNES